MDIQSQIFSRDDVEAVYSDFGDTFAQQTEMYDNLVHADLTALRESGRLSQEDYLRISENKGYATMRRVMEVDEVV